MARPGRLFSYGSLIVLGILVLAGAYYLYDKYGNSGLSPIDAIPANSSAFIILNKPGHLVNELSEKNKIWLELSKAEPLNNYLRMAETADSVLRSLSYSEWLDQGQLYVVLAGDSTSAAACLLFEWPYGADKGDVEKLLSALFDKELTRQERKYINVKGYALMSDGEEVAHYGIRNGLCMLGNTASIIEACAYRMKNKTPLPSNELYERVAATAGRNVHANVFVNFNQIANLGSSIFATDYFKDRRLLPSFGSWAEIDLLLKNDEVLLNGYTETVDSLNQFLGIFQDQDPQKIEITRILPYNTSIVVSIGFEDFGSLYTRNAAFMINKGVYESRGSDLTTLKKQLGPAVEDHMTSWIGNEVALAVINPHLKDPSNNSFVAIHARDIEMGVRKLKALGGNRQQGTYRGYSIRSVPGKRLMKVMLGRIFSVIENNYYTRIEDYIVFANSRNSLENFINIFLSGKTLEQNENFKQFTDNVSDRSNLFCYFNIRNSTSMLEEILAPELAQFVKLNNETVQNFEALAVQFKALNKMYFTSVYIKYNPSYIKEDLAIWKAYLDAPVHGSPYFVKDHRTNKLKIVTFDTLNNMYLIDHDGSIVWKLNIGEKVISEVHTVDYYKNGKIQYLFNTNHKIYLIDLLGRDVEGYPVSLPEVATNGLAVFDYENKKDYRIMLALDDNRVYCYDIKGKKINGWKKPMSKGIVDRPVQHLKVKGKDYIIIADAEGNVKITNRRGNSRINLKSPLENGTRSEFYVNETNSKGIIITTDASGKLTYIKDNGRLDFTDFGKFSRNHYFLYEDFDNKGGKDFIFLDGNKLVVYDRFKKVIFSHEFENEIHSSPLIIPVSRQEKLIGVVSEESGKIYLFDRKGRLLSTPDHIGRAGMLIGSLNRDGQLNLISGSGNTIYNYYFR